MPHSWDSVARARTSDPLPARRLVAGTPVGMLLVLAGMLGVCKLGVVLGVLPPAALRIGAIAAGHGAMLATALTWAAADARPPWNARWSALITIVLLGLGTAASTLGEWGAVAYLGVPLWLALLTARGRLAPLGLSFPVPAIAVMLGLGIGLALGGHLLLSAGRTLGYRLRDDGLAAYLAAVAYDVGANVPSSEGFFRGALFNRAQRLAPFGPAVVLSVGAALVRYVADPLLPKTVEVMAGTLLYIALLGVTNAWLLSWSGSLVPALVSSLVFFAAYRMLLIA